MASGPPSRPLAKKEQQPAPTFLPAWLALDDLNACGPQGVHQRAGIVFGAVAGVDLRVGCERPRDGLLFGERGGSAGHVHCRQAGAAKLESPRIAHGLGKSNVTKCHTTSALPKSPHLAANGAGWGFGAGDTIYAYMRTTRSRRTSA